VTTPAALLAYIPRAYRDWRTPTPIGSLREADGETIVVGRIVHVKERKGRLALITVVLADDTGRVEAKLGCCPNSTSPRTASCAKEKSSKARSCRCTARRRTCRPKRSAR
jgi:hypothetical protein